MNTDINEKLVTERIGKDLKDHVVTVLHADGLHRRWRCMAPGTWNMGFEIITWPGSICYTGDMGDYLFQRTNDMIAFMRGSCMSYSYAAEKCVAHDGRLSQFSEELFHQALKDRVEESDDGMVTVFRHGERRREPIQPMIDEIISAYDINNDQHAALEAMYNSGLWDCEVPQCQTWTVHFLWCLHAIRWFIGKIDAGDVRHEAAPTKDPRCYKCGSIVGYGRVEHAEGCHV